LSQRERYGWTWLFHHLLGAGHRDELVRTARDLGYLAAKTAASSSLAVEADLAIAEGEAPDDVVLARLRRSYGQSAHVLARCRSAADAAATLCSRLAHVDELGAAVAAFAGALRGPRLVAAHPLPDIAHPALVRTLVHSGRVLACAVSADGRRIVAAGSNPAASCTPSSATPPASTRSRSAATANGSRRRRAIAACGCGTRRAVNRAPSSPATPLRSPTARSVLARAWP
jgi:hypothetical protein